MSKTPTSLSDVATRHQVFLERLKTQLGLELALMFEDVERETRESILSLDVEKVSELSTKKLNTFLAALFVSNLTISAKVQEDLFLQLEELAGYETGFEARALKALSSKLPVKTFPASKAFDAVMSQPITANGKLLESFVKGWSASEMERVNDTIRSAWGQGWTTGKLVAALRGTKKLGYADGILGGPNSIAALARRNAVSVVHTAVQHVASNARMAVWQANADILDGWQFVATLDSRTTQRCRSLDGKKFQLGEGPVPPLHIRCRSTTVPVMKKEFQFLEEGATRSSLDGYVPADMTYYDWLKGQSAEFQNAAIGPTRAKLFRDGGLTPAKFADLNLGRNFQPLTLEHMKKLEPLAFERAGIPTQ